MVKKTKLPADINSKVKSIVDMATEDQSLTHVIKAAATAAALGRMGGLKGGKARAAALTPKRRSEIAKKAADARWKK